jgi:hypothetical protein
MACDFKPKSSLFSQIEQVYKMPGIPLSTEKLQMN